MISSACSLSLSGYYPLLACLLAKSLVFSWALNFDRPIARPIARSFARPLARLPTFSLAYWLDRSQSYINPQKRKKNFKQDRLNSRLAICCCLHVADRLLAHFLSLACLPIPTHLLASFCSYFEDIEALAERVSEPDWDKAFFHVWLFACSLISYPSFARSPARIKSKRATGNT